MKFRKDMKDVDSRRYVRNYEYVEGEFGFIPSEDLGNFLIFSNDIISSSILYGERSKYFQVLHLTYSGRSQTSTLFSLSILSGELEIFQLP